MTEREIIKTSIFKGHKEFLNKRTKLISEAIAFQGGTIKKPIKHLISSLPNGKEAYFFKPGKETTRKIPNMYDTIPNVGANGISITENWAFEKVWEYLIKISIISQSTFKKVLVILYRVCYLLDHKENADGNLRYSPSTEILEYINNIEKFVLKDGFKDKFKSKEIMLLEYLHFIDLLGWNEDVKYHVVDGKPDFKKFPTRTGRVNTILSVINIVLILEDYVRKPYEDVDMNFLVPTFLMPRGKRDFAEISNKELIMKMKPYLIAS